MKIILEQNIILTGTETKKLIKKEYETDIIPVIGAGVNTNDENMNMGSIEEIILDFENNCNRIYLGELELDEHAFNKL